MFFSFISSEICELVVSHLQSIILSAILLLGNLLFIQPIPPFCRSAIYSLLLSCFSIFFGFTTPSASCIFFPASPSPEALKENVFATTDTSSPKYKRSNKRFIDSCSSSFASSGVSCYYSFRDSLFKDCSVYAGFWDGYVVAGGSVQVID